MIIDKEQLEILRVILTHFLEEAVKVYGIRNFGFQQDFMLSFLGFRSDYIEVYDQMHYFVVEADRLAQKVQVNWCIKETGIKRDDCINALRVLFKGL